MGGNQDQIPRHLSQTQISVFDYLRREAYIKDRFYFTGGTALSAFYLHHRYSEDLDFFSLKPLEHEVLRTLLSTLCDHMSCTFTSRIIEFTMINRLKFEDGTELKVDFVHYNHPLLVQGIEYEGLKIDSLRDIATNKMLCVGQRTEIKDFIDLYYLLKKWNVWTISYGFEKKFPQDFDPLIFSADLTKITDFTELPRMILPLTLEELRAFYLDLAKELARTKLV